MTLALAPGLVVGGKYRLDRRLGRGGMGEVWGAEQIVTRHHVAVKFLVGAAANTPDMGRRFLREARAACAVDHPNVVQVHDVIETEDGSPAIVMELLRGESLETHLQRSGRLTVEDTVAIVARVVSAVGSAHALGIVHRDIKPDNIFLAEGADGVQVKVLDFGVAKFSKAEDVAATAALTSTGAMLGTPFYMSPEQAFGEKQIDHRADIWSIGIVLYRCLSGTLPTQADNLGQVLKTIMTRSFPPLAAVAPHVPKALAAMVERMLAYSPSDRPADLREVKTVLEEGLGAPTADFGPPAIDATSLDGVSTPLPELRGATRRRRLRRSLWLLGAAAVAGSLGAAALLLPRGDGGQPGTSPAAAPDAGPQGAELGAPPSAAIPASAAATATAAPSPSPSESVSPAPSLARPSRAAATARATATAGATAAPSAQQSFGGIVEKPAF